MKATRPVRPKSFTPKLSSTTFSLSTAKTYLGRLTDKAMKGEPVYIVRGEHRFVLRHLPPFDPIPLRPAGYFANHDTAAETATLNQQAKASVIRAPQDLE